MISSYIRYSVACTRNFRSVTHVVPEIAEPMHIYKQTSLSISLANYILYRIFVFQNLLSSTTGIVIYFLNFY